MKPVNTYNCLDYRREKLADPKRLSAPARAHEHSCSACRDFARRIDNHAAQLETTLAVTVPEGLADRVLLRVHHGTGRPWKLWALAASVIFSLGLGIEQWQPRPTPDAARVAIEHVLHEPEAFTDARLADPGQFRFVLANFGGEMQAPLGAVRFMKLCPVAQGTAWHIVLDTEHGEVTLLLIPDAKPGSEIYRGTMEGYSAQVQPGGQGYVAVITRSPYALDRATRMVDERVRWRT